jgi:hypothetical protein
MILYHVIHLKIIQIVTILGSLFDGRFHPYPLIIIVTERRTDSMCFLRKKLNPDTYKIFYSVEEVKVFLKEYYETYLHNLTASETNLIISSHSHGMRSTDEYDCSVIETIKRVLNDVPPTPYNIALFRGDDRNYYKDKMRPFLAHTFLKCTAENFTKKDNIYKIYIPAGSKILPTCGLKPLGSFPEQEVILETAKLKKISKFSYIYINT